MLREKEEKINEENKFHDEFHLTLFGAKDQTLNETLCMAKKQEGTIYVL